MRSSRPGRPLRFVVYISESCSGNLYYALLGTHINRMRSLLHVNIQHFAPARWLGQGNGQDHQRDRSHSPV